MRYRSVWYGCLLLRFQILYAAAFTTTQLKWCTLPHKTHRSVTPIAHSNAVFGNTTGSAVAPHNLRRSGLYNQLQRITQRNVFSTIKRVSHPDLIHGMRYRYFGNSSMLISELGLGTENMGSKVMIDDEDALLQLDIATKEYGINLLDIAEFDPIPYNANTWGRGHTEILRKFLKSIPRESIVLSVRVCSGNLGKDSKGWLFKWIRGSNRPPAFSKMDMQEAIDGILNRLGVEHIDILQLDRPNRYVPRAELGEDTYCWGFESKGAISIEEQLDILSSFVKSGKVRHIGVSNETPWGLFSWAAAAKRLGMSGIVSTQSLYNILHRNEFESAGFPEMLDPRNLNIPLIAYGTLAGGILTGKYLDPERFNARGPDQRLGQDEWDGYVSTFRGNVPEDWGYLSYGPLTGKCNKFPEFYHTHRSVWSQWKTGELIKIARSYGMTLSQLALGWVVSRPFVGSTLIGPRTIGQLRESIRSLNYPIYHEIEQDVHEVFLRYRAPTMGGPQILSGLEDSPKPQHDYIKYGRGPIWSGGTFWPNFPQPILPKKLEFLDSYDNLIKVMLMAGVFDDPSDSNWKNFRLWKERLEEDKPGEYFALKESILFGWNEKKIWNWDFHRMTESEKKEVDTLKFHFVWKDNKVYRENTTQTMLKFYENEKAVLSLLSDRLALFQDDLMYEKELGHAPDVFNALDFDLIDQELREKHNIDITDMETWKTLIIGKQNLTEFELKTIPFWYWENGHPDDPSPGKQSGSFL